MKIHLWSNYDKAKTLMSIIEEREALRKGLNNSKTAYTKIEPIVKTPKESKKYTPNKINDFFTRIFQRKNQGVG